jgi:hypothetical protein
MAQKEALAYIESQLDSHIKDFDSSRRFHRRQLLRITMITSVLSSVTTILIASEKIAKWEGLSLMALVSSASITVIAAYDQFLQSRARWVQTTDTWMALQNLKLSIGYAKAKKGELDEEEVDNLNNRFAEIIKGELNLWKDVRVHPSPQPKSAT